MNIRERVLALSTVKRIQSFFDAYGMGMLFAANVFGAGSMYILSTTGAQFGYLLLWTMLLALFVDLGMHEMSGRLATINKPLMEYISEVIGDRLGKIFAGVVAFIMHFWTIANYSVAGAALAYLTPINNLYIGILLIAGLGISLLELKVYERIEAAISVMILTVFGIYVVLISGLNLPLRTVMAGFIPMIQSNIGFLTAMAGLFGTTVYYPNFFIQSSMYPSKQWADMQLYRRDNFIGIFVTVIVSLAVIIVSAATLSSGQVTLTAPGQPLVPVLGDWALTVFVIGVLLAAFSSGTGTIFGAGFMVPQAWGKQTIFGDRRFRRVVEGLIGMSVVFAILLLEFTELTPVRLGLTMPAVNGVVGLPLTALALYFANGRFFDHPRWLRAYFGVIVLLMFVLAVLTGQSLLEQILNWI